MWKHFNLHASNSDECESSKIQYVIFTVIVYFPLYLQICDVHFSITRQTGISSELCHFITPRAFCKSKREYVRECNNISFNLKKYIWYKISSNRLVKYTLVNHYDILKSDLQYYNNNPRKTGPRTFWSNPCPHGLTAVQLSLMMFCMHGLTFHIQGFES